MNQEIQQKQIQNPSIDTIDLKKIFFLVLGHWYYFLIVLGFALGGAFLHLRYTMPVYRVSTSLLIEEGSKSGVTGTEELLKGFGLKPGSKNLDNQIQILSSYTLIEATLQELPYVLDYYVKGRVKTASLYPNSPIVVVPDSGSVLPSNLEFSFRYLEENTYELSIAEKDIVAKATFGQHVNYKGIGSFTILPNPEYWPPEPATITIFFKFIKMDDLVVSYRNRLKVAAATKEGTIVNLTMEGTNKEKDKDFLNKLTEVFLARNLDKKNQEASRVIEFIDKQLVGISDSLMITENKLQEFRSRNKVMDVSAQGQQIIQQAVKLEDEKARLLLESNYFDYLTRYLSSANTQETPIAPATMGIVDPMLTQLVQELSQLQAEYYSGGMGDKNPFQNQILTKIKNTRQSLQETLKNISHANNLAQQENMEQIHSLNAQAAGLPVTERKLLGIERDFKLNDVLYTFLLQRRAEAQIQKASNTTDNELVDPARADRAPIAPNTNFIYLVALILGLGLPAAYLLLVDFFNTKINSEDELKKLSDLPIVGHIPHSELSYQTVVLQDPDSPIAEAFRSLRTRMQFFIKEAKSPVVLVTSSMPREGKTFTALNLASAYSLTGKKTVLIGFDLRRPKLYGDFDLKNETGVSTWLIGRDGLDTIIQPTSYDNLHLIAAGPVPPNPAELASSEKMRELIDLLRERYEYIVIDSAPIGTVSDSYAITDMADATLLIVRHQKTLRDMLKNTISEAKDNEVKGLSLLVNDMDTQSLSYRYAYSYKYGYKYEKE
jgi:capsular exopolysaccharide synthesis family protein